MKTIKIVLTFTLMVALMAFGFYWLSKDAEDSRLAMTIAMNNGL